MYLESPSFFSPCLVNVKRGVPYLNCFATTDSDSACLVGHFQVAVMDQALRDSAYATPARSIVEGLAAQFS